VNNGDYGDVVIALDDDEPTDTVLVVDMGNWLVIELLLLVVVVTRGDALSLVTIDDGARPPPVMDVVKLLLFVVCVGEKIVLVSVALSAKGEASRQYPEASQHMGVFALPESLHASPIVHE
jgi:hypothetical protein